MDTIVLEEAEEIPEPKSLWRSFEKEFRRLPYGGGRFDSFAYLFEKYAWAVPCTYEEPGISLYEEFKALSALLHASNGADSPSDEVLIISGDFPGIQRFVYTVTSSGAAKTLRGRSFYLQLLGETMVRVILRELALPVTNVIYNAGGNFKILAPLEAEGILEDLHSEINERLLLLHQGELFLALVWVPVASEHLVDDDHFASAMASIAERTSLCKQAPFAGLLEGPRQEEAYDSLFGPQGIGGKHFCDVCGVDLPSHIERCAQCRSFESLASMLARLDPGSKMFVYETASSLANVPRPGLQTTGGHHWERVVRALGFHYAFEEVPNREAIEEQTLNATHFLPSARSRRGLSPAFSRILAFVRRLVPFRAGRRKGTTYAFRFLANATPQILTAEETRLKSHFENEKQLQDSISARNIRSTTIMARYDATGLCRYGVLRMDVDNLGSAFSFALKREHARDLLHVSALSAAVSRFFDGELNHLVAIAAERWSQILQEVIGSGKRTDDIAAIQPYIIYAGGDDLFIVSYWDLLPVLADDIRSGWQEYTRSRLTMSAGIALAEAKFPLYRAATDAGDYLDKAKERLTIDQYGNTARPKAACTFLDITLGWPDIEIAQQLTMQLASLVGASEEQETIPRSLLSVMAHAATSHKYEFSESRGARTTYGRWMWTMAYAMDRRARRLEDISLKQRVVDLRNRILDNAYGWQPGNREPIIEFLELPVYWADCLTRKEEST
jgi:CRISPR-associated protein Csm1